MNIATIFTIIDIIDILLLYQLETIVVKIRF